MAETGQTNRSLNEAERAEIVQSVADKITNGDISVSLSDADIANIVNEVLANLKADSTDVATLPKVQVLDGVVSIPAIKNDTSIVSVPLELLVTNKPIEIADENELRILEAQGKIIDSQLYFTSEGE